MESSSEFKYPSSFLSKALKIASPTSFFPSGGGPLGDPLLLEDHILFLKLASKSDIERIKIISYSINKHLTKIFDKIGIILVDFKLEFGKEVNIKKQSIILGDEISPDTCRLWDKKSKRKLDKDRFRRDLGKVIESYQEVANRLGINLDGLK